MNILSIDTAMLPHSIAFSNNEHISPVTLNESTQSDFLFFEINLLLEKYGIDYKELEVILCTIGPGSFTGIRVGVAALRGIKKTLPQLRLCGFTTLELLAFLKNRDAPGTQDFHVIINAFGNELYVQKFDSNTNSISEILVISKQNFIINQNPQVVVSNDKECLAYLNTEKIEIHFIHYDASTIIEYHNKFHHKSQQVKPLYLKKPNIHYGAIRKNTA
jgi:tRNA threonylcarbamoyl adenosine modification protein YeaZ